MLIILYQISTPFVKSWQSFSILWKSASPISEGTFREFTKGWNPIPDFPVLLLLKAEYSAGRSILFPDGHTFLILLYDFPARKVPGGENYFTRSNPP